MTSIVPLVTTVLKSWKKFSVINEKHLCLNKLQCIVRWCFPVPKRKREMGANLFFTLPSLLVKADDELTGSFIWHLANEHWTKWVDFALAVFLIISASLQVSDVIFEVVEGDPRNVLCEAVEKHHASVLVVGSHGYGAIKRYLILSSLFAPPNDPMYLILFSNLVH